MLRGTATAAFEDHQIAVIERGRAPASRPPSARAEGPRSSAAGSRQHCRSCRCDRLPPDPPLIASGSLSLGASPRSGTRFEFSELSHIESLWEFSLNSDLQPLSRSLSAGQPRTRVCRHRDSGSPPAPSVFAGGEASDAIDSQTAIDDQFRTRNVLDLLRCEEQRRMQHPRHRPCAPSDTARPAGGPSLRRYRHKRQ